MRVRIQSFVTLAAVPLVPISVYLVLRISHPLGLYASFSLGYGLYWLGWCIAFPLMIVGRRRLRELLRPGKPLTGGYRRLAAAAIVLPVVLSFAFAGLFEAERARFPASPWLMLAIAIPMSVWNGLLEELLWRGVFTEVFPGHALAGLLLPAVGFGAWHLGPYLAEQTPELSAAVLLIGGGSLLGLCWNWLSQRTGSIRLAVASHIAANLALFVAII